MKSMEPYEENTFYSDDSQWMPYEKYTENDKTVAYSWTEEDMNNLMKKTFPYHMICRNNEHVESQFKKEEICSTDSHKNINKCKENKTDKNDSRENNIDSGETMGDKTVTNRLFQGKSSKEYWEQLSISAPKKKSPKKITCQWKNRYLNVLSLHNHLCERNSAHMDITCDGVQCLNSNTNDLLSLNSDESECEQTEEMLKTCDPIYSRFGEIQHAFHTSEDGIVFYTQKELDDYKLKMADMKEVLDFELGLIKHQHDQLKAKRAEEEKLLSKRMNSQDVPDEEATERDALNMDNNKQNSSKQERKSALFSSFTDAFSYARTGIQGIFVKNSPNVSRKMRSNNKDSDSSDEEEETLGATLLSQNPDALPDNHDEFTRKMTSEGGLKYTSSDKTDQQLSYQNLPPPLSLSSLPNKT